MKTIIPITLKAPALAILTFTIPATLAYSFYYGTLQLESGLIFAMFAAIFVYPPTIITSAVLTFIHKYKPFNLWKALPLAGFSIIGIEMAVFAYIDGIITAPDKGLCLISIGATIGTLTGLFAACMIARRCSLLTQLS